MDDQTISNSSSPRLLDGVGEADLMGRAIAVLRAKYHCTALEARTRLNELAAKSPRDVFVLAAEIVYAASIKAIRPATHHATTAPG